MGTWIIGSIVIAALAFAAYRTFKKQKSGGCGCGCAGCPEASKCHKQ